MGETTRRDLARARAVEVMRLIYENVLGADGLNVAEAAAAGGVPVSTFYRWLKTPPKKIDLTAIAAVADYLHDAHGYEDFGQMWRRVCTYIK